MIVYKNKNGYAFRIGNFDSSVGYFVFPHVKSSYKYAWKAEYDGRKILREMRSVLAGETDAQESEPFNPKKVETAEDMILSHYYGAYDALVDKADGVKGADEDTRSKVYEEIKIVVQSLLKIQDQMDEEESKAKIDKIIGKFSRLVKGEFNDFLSKDQKKQAINVVERFVTASVRDVLSEQEERELLEDSAQKVCMALQDRFPNAIYMLEPSNKKITIAACEDKIKYLTLFFDEDMLLERILPHSYMPSLNSSDFYQNIFKPIFESVGHFKFAGKGVLIVNGKTHLPDVTANDSTFDIDCIDVSTKEPCATAISFSNKKWKTSSKLPVATAQSKYTEMDYTKDGGAIVECIDQELDSLYGKKGVVVQVAPIGANVYVDVDFGNATVRLIEPQIRIVSDELQTPK